MVSTVRLNKTTCPLIFSSKNRWTQSNWPVTQLNQFEPFHNPRLHEHKVADTQFQLDDDSSGAVMNEYHNL